jgi:hypothetical protein
MNQMFPEDKTKIWTETKAAAAMQNRTMGYPHDNIYQTGDTLSKMNEKINTQLNDADKK